MGGADIAFYVGDAVRMHTRQCMRHPRIRKSVREAEKFRVLVKSLVNLLQEIFAQAFGPGGGRREA